MDFRLIQVEETALRGLSKPFDREKYPTREALRHVMWDAAAGDVPGKLCNGRWNEPGNTAYDGVWYGIWRNGSYTIARQAEKTQKEGLEEHSLSAGMYAAFRTVPGGLAWEELPRLFEEIFEAWLPDADYILRGGDIVEVYHLWSDHDERKKNRYYEVWIPVERK